ncbi:MAG TPA: outer membrane protein assembly factor BamD [Polyangiaceae bacterium]|nr:outer membrane protein assembly factor BamD [Polyangiaceae bacterium]
MSDRPWLQETDGALRDERLLLKRLNAQAPPAGSVDQGWAALSAVLPGLKTAATISAASSTATTFGLAAKIAVGVVATGAALWTGGRFLESDRSEHTLPPSAPHSAPAVTAPIEPPATPEQAEQSASVLEAPDRPPAPATRPSVSTSTLGEEGRLVSQAHRLIQSGQGGAALKVLRTLESRYPRSVLSQEREVLTIEALGATGDSSAARARAKRFVERYPKSPHAVRLQRFVE